MNKPSIIQTKTLAFGAITTAAICAALTAQAQTVVFNETFDPLSSGAHVQAGYIFGDTTADSSAVVSGVGLSGTAAWQTVNTASSGANGYSGVGAQYQNGNTILATDPNLSDYVLSFYAMENNTGGNAPNLTLTIQTWTGTGFGGTMTGSLTAGANGVGTISLTPAYTLYSLNLGNSSVFQTMSAGFSPAGGTYQVAFQLNGGGATPYTDTLNVDDLELTIVPEPGTITLCGLGLVAGAAFLRRRKA
jgi:PEP-CTERM motif